MFKKLWNKLGFFGVNLGVDLGTKNTLVYVEKRGIIINEPSVVAINLRTTEILGIGREAQKMVGKTPDYIQTVKPLVDGVISDFEVTEKMLKHFIRQAHKDNMSWLSRPRVIIGVPLGITEVEKKAVADAAKSAGAREVYLVDEIMAAAVGTRLNVLDATANMVVDIGGGTTDIAVISLGGVVTFKSLRFAGNEFDKNIIEYVRDEFNLLIGEQLAEQIKITIGSAIPLPEPRLLEIRGRDLVTGLPKAVMISDAQVREALSRTVNKIVENVKLTLEATPPELVADIYERGIILTGGGALLSGLDKLISSSAKTPVTIADDPLTAMVRGTGLLFADDYLLSKVTVLPEIN